MRMFSTRANLNQCAVTEAFIDEIVANKNDYICMPLCADVPKLKNKDYRGLTHLYDKTRGVFLADEIGSFYDFEKVHDEYGVSLIGYARINKRSALVCEAIQEMYDQGNLNFSFEISAGKVDIIDGISIVDAHEENELTAMAVVSIPAYPESKALDLVAEAEITIDRFYENANVLISEIDFETVRERFFELLYQMVDPQRPFYPRVLLFCPDCVIFYEHHSGRTFKAEYMIDGEDFVIKDLYEIKFERSEKVGEDNMNTDKPEMNQEFEQVAEVVEETVAVAEAEVETVVETETAEVEASETEAVEETAENQESEDVGVEAETAEESAVEEVAEVVSVEDPRIAELQAENDELKIQVAELLTLKAELDQIKAEREEADKKAERESLSEFAKDNGLDPENEMIAEAIANLDHKTLVAEIMANNKKNTKPEANVSFRENSDIKPTGNRNYLFERG